MFSNRSAITLFADPKTLSLFSPRGNERFLPLKGFKGPFELLLATGTLCIARSVCVVMHEARKKISRTRFTLFNANAPARSRVRVNERRFIRGARAIASDMRARQSLVHEEKAEKSSPDDHGSETISGQRLRAPNGRF